jgi:hypothetical protein
VGYEPDDKGICIFQFIYNLVNYFRWFRIFKNCKKAIGRLVNHYHYQEQICSFLAKLSMEEKMSGKEMLGIQETEKGRKMEISFERVASWSLIFTNAFFVSYFFAKLFKWV